MKFVKLASLTIAILFAYLPSFAQKLKVKEKKDIVYVNDVAMYKYIRTKGMAISSAQEKAILTMNDDTLVWVKPAELTMPKTIYETGTQEYVPYDVLTFAGIDSIIPTKVNINYICEDLIKNGVLKDGKVDVTAMPAYRKELANDLWPVTNLQQAIDNRKKLADLPEYAEYTKHLTKRFTMDRLQVGLGTIYFQNSSGKITEHIGTFEKKTIKRGTEYRIGRKSDKGYIASIIYEPYSRMGYIETVIDKGSYSFPVTVPFDNNILLNCLQYLVSYGYL